MSKGVEVAPGRVIVVWRVCQSFGDVVRAELRPSAKDHQTLRLLYHAYTMRILDVFLSFS